jgi:hypothetical protein
MTASPDPQDHLYPPDAPASVDSEQAMLGDPSTYELLQKLLAQEPLLVYLDETDELYHVRHNTNLDLSVNKNRSLPEPFPDRKPALLRKAYRWLWMACLGLLFAGLGAMVFATMAAAAALGFNLQPISRTDRIRSLVILLLSGALWLGGLLLGAILLLHIL